MKKRKVYAAIVGGGASGLICAARAASRYRDRVIVVIESADRTGKKLLVTGNGRCNLSNMNASAARYHGKGSAELIDSLYAQYSPEAVIGYFAELGLMTRADSEDRVYPRSNLASSVLDVLRLELRRLGVEEICSSPVSDIRPVRGGYEITAAQQIIYAEKVVIAAGGRADYAGRPSAAAGLTDGLGISTERTSPALAPVRVSSDILRSLKGIRANASVTLCDRSGAVRSTRGEVQFTENALSGICVFDLAGEAGRRSGCRLVVDLLPELSREETEAEFKRRQSRLGSERVAELFTGICHKNLGVVVLKRCGIKPTELCKDISDRQLKSITDTLRGLSFDVDGKADFRGAQVTAGGISLSETDPLTFELKKYPGMYAVGEALDVDGDCGGYNLQFAWASGMRAGDSL